VVTDGAVTKLVVVVVPVGGVVVNAIPAVRKFINPDNGLDA
jgi:hypothetical protein